MNKTVTVRPRAWLPACAWLLALVAVVAAPLPAQASPATEAACAHEGALAEKLAVARDKGMTMAEAIEMVLSGDRTATREQVAAQAALLFQRFRRMPAEQAAFEFTLACMDDAS